MHEQRGQCRSGAHPQRSVAKEPRADGNKQRDTGRMIEVARTELP